MNIDAASSEYLFRQRQSNIKESFRKNSDEDEDEDDIEIKAKRHYDNKSMDTCESGVELTEGVFV